VLWCITSTEGEEMNAVLLLILISGFCIALCTWLSPECLRWAAAHLLTRADVIEVSREERKRRMRFWSKELRIDAAVAEEGNDTIGPVRAFARR
jgi:hypothetical protein